MYEQRSYWVDCVLNLFKSCVAKSASGHEISVQIIPLKRRQNVTGGQKWVVVGNQVLLQTGEEVAFNPDGRSFFVSPNTMYRLVC